VAASKDPNVEVTTSNREMWWTLLRRLYDVPELLGDDLALSVMAMSFPNRFKEVEDRQPHETPPLDLAVSVVWSLKDCAVRGVFDVRLLSEEQRQALG
jgi:hypothetical protein